MMEPRWNRVINSSGVQPKPRQCHRAVAIKELIVIFGGGNGEIFNDLFVYNTLKNEWITPTVKGDIPSGRAAFGFVVNKTRIVVCGGILEYRNITCDIYALQTITWEWKKITPKPPADSKPPPHPRLGHSFTLIGNMIYLFGGMTLEQFDIQPRYFNDLYILDCSNKCMSWNIPVTYGKTPSPRESHTSVAYKNSHGNQNLIVYGGMSGCSKLGDIWILKINSMTWFEVESSPLTPLGRSLHTATLVGDKMFVFGGWVPVQNENRMLCEQTEFKVDNKLECFDLSTMSWNDMTNFSPSVMPKARAGHSAVEVENRIYIWSGRDSYRPDRSRNIQIYFDDMWYLEIEKPPAMTQPQLLKSEPRSLEIQWNPTLSAACYILQIQKYDINPSSCTMEDLCPLKPPTLMQKLPSEALPTFNRSGSGFTLAVSKPNIPNQICSIRPLAMPMIKVNSASGASKLGQKFILSNLKNLVPLSGTIPKTLKPPPLVLPNSGLKLVAVNQNPIGASKILVKLPPLLKENFTYNCPAPAEKPKASPSIVFSESDILQSHQITKNPHSSEPGSSSCSSGLKKTLLSEPESNTQFPLKVPSHPELVEAKMCKVTERIHLSWSSPSGDMVTFYKVALVNEKCFSGFKKRIPIIIYTGVDPECFITKSLLDSAYKREGGIKPLKLHISAKNNKGYGPPLVVEWPLHPSG